MNGGSAVVKEINGGDAVARSNADAAQGKNRDTAAVSYATVHRARSLSRRAGFVYIRGPSRGCGPNNFIGWFIYGPIE